jgi:uncharacterized membrane protein YwaF
MLGACVVKRQYHYWLELRAIRVIMVVCKQKGASFADDRRGVSDETPLHFVPISIVLIVMFVHRIRSQSSRTMRFRELYMGLGC